MHKTKDVIILIITILSFFNYLLPNKKYSEHSYYLKKALEQK